MADLHTLWLLFSHFVVVSLMGVGGGVVAVLPEISRYVVDTQHWMSAEELASAFALAQAAPGPNMLFVTLIGWHVAGWVGGLVATFAAIGPATVLGLVVWRAREKATIGPIGRAIHVGLAPMAAGLMLSTGLMLSRTVIVQWSAAITVAATVFIMLRYRPNPVWLIAIGAAAGMLGWL